MTIADFKRVAKKGAYIRGGYFWRLGINTKDISGLDWRKITAVQSNGIYINGSFLDFPKARLAEFDGRILKIYAAGYRKMNAKEMAVMKEWQAIAETNKHQKQAEYDAMTDTNLCYWQAKAFFEERGFEYLYYGKKKGMKLDTNIFRNYDYESLCIRDEKIKGEQIAEYEVKNEG